MKKILFFLFVLLGIAFQAGAQCATCGSFGSIGKDTGPNFRLSLGAALYGQSAGDLTFGSSVPTTVLFTPAALQYDSPSRTDVTVLTNSDGSIRQVYAPQALVDVPVPTNSNGYVINFYYSSQVGILSNGVYLLSGSPFVTWGITNPTPTTITNFQVSKIGINPNYGLMKQWTYVYDTNTATWAVQSLGGLQKNMTMTNLSTNTYQIVNSVQATNGPVVQQTKTIYQSFSWGAAPIEVDTGTGDDIQRTTYTYYSSGLADTVSNADGSWQYYASYDGNNRPTIVYSAYGDDAVGDTSGSRETDYTYGGISGSGDDGTLNPSTPRRVVQKIAGTEVSDQYSVFPSVGVALNIQCTTTNAAWSDSRNLVTTNLYYTSGPNQFALQATIRPDGTMTTYNYLTNSAGTSQTNITATGQPDSGLTHIVDGTSNQIVLNQWGHTLSSTSWDVKSGLLIAQDTYGNFDNYGRPQQVTHLDGTTEYTQYACCGLESTIDRDGVATSYLYDAARRQVGYVKFYNAGTNNPITWQNTLDAAGRTLQTFRTGTDNSSILQNQSAYDAAGELISQTNTLGGVTVYTRTNDPGTGGLIRTTLNPDGGTLINYYYADGSLKETIGSAVHGKAYGYGIGTDYNSNPCTFTTETNLDVSGNPTSEWTKTFTDMAGRTTEVLYADGNKSLSYYNSQGQLSKQVDPDGVVTLYQYNGKGEQSVTAVDMDRNGTIDPSGTDRISSTINDVTTDHSITVQRASTYVWLTATSNLVSVVESSPDGLKSWQTQYRDASVSNTVSSQTVPGTTRVMTTYAPDGSYTVSTYSYGRLISSTRYDSSNNQIGATTYGYDAHGRQNTTTDARNGTTTLGFDNADLATTVTTPSPGGTGGSPQTTTTAYSTLMQATNVTQPDGTSVTSFYLLTGELGQQSGSRTYPVGYSYDYAGRMKTMTNWSSFPGTGARVTTWNYDGQRGWLTNKAYADGTGPTYSNTPAGRLASRKWVRGITTTYAYDAGGSLTNAAYSDATPGVGYTYDRLGRQSKVVCNGMTNTLAYNLANELLGEAFSGGTLNGLAVTNNFDQFMRRTNLTSLNGASTLATALYTYDAASRLSTASDGTNNAAYGYLANSPLVKQITFKSNSVTRMTTSKSYDHLNRLTQISSAPSGSGQLPLNFNYNYNNANQRTRNTLVDGSYWVYGYDSLGQVTSGVKYWPDGTPVAGQQFDYTFDNIGNRTQTQAGGDAAGANLRTANYTNNSLNQITSRDVPGYVDIKGAALTNTVTVNGQTTYRRGEYFRDELNVTNVNNSSMLWTNIIVAATGQTSVTGNVYVAQSPEILRYDADGNTTNDGRFTYLWDGENRLTNMTSLATAPTGSKVKLDFLYDYQGRRIQKIVSTNNGTAYVAQSTNRFLYDGWNLVAELNPSSSLIRSYVWGSDLSGSMQGAGGVSGLLEVSYYGSSTTNCFPAFDGNGNVAGLINAADGTTVANYEYGPFGEPIRITGAMAKNSPFLFSTKYYDLESGLYYYGYRFYNSSTGTWPNKDPISELGFILLKDGWIKRNSYHSNSDYCPSCAKHGNTVDMHIGDLNAYAFAGNDSVDRLDYLGLDIGTTVEAAWEAAQKALPGDEFVDAFKVFGACNSLGLGLAWAKTQYQDCLGDALNGPPSQDGAAETACQKKWQPMITLLQNTYDTQCKCTVPPKHWWWPF